MALKGEAKKEYNANYREAQKNAKVITAASETPAAQKEKEKGARPSMPLVDSYPKISPMDLKKVTDEYNVEDEKVADYIADVVYKHTFNYVGAAAEIAKGKSAADQAALGYYWRAHPAIQASVQRMMSRIGLDDDAKKKFVAALWNDFYNGGGRDKANAQKILALAFGFGSKNVADNNKPTELPISDLSKGLSDMGLGDGVTSETPAGEFTDNMKLLEDDEDEQDDVK